MFRGLTAALAGGTGMTARAAGFVAIGIAIGTMVGLVQVLLRNAWLTVVDGFGPGRQLILAGVPTPLGSSPAAGFLIEGQGVAELHAALVPTSSGYEVEDQGSPLGTAVNGRPISGRSRLVDGDVIRIGSTYLRFNTAARTESDEDETAPVSRPPAPVRSQPIPTPTRATVAAPLPPAPPKLRAAPMPTAPPRPSAVQPVAAPRPSTVPKPAPAKPAHKCPECGAGVEKATGVCPDCGAMY